MSILVIAEHNQHTLKASNRQLVQAALACGDDVHMLVAGENCDEVVEQARLLSGVAKVLHVESSILADALPEALAEQVFAIAHSYSHILAASDAFGKGVLPRVAARLDVEQIANITRVIDPNTFVRPIYAANALATVVSEDPIKVITVRTTSFSPVSDGEKAPVEQVQPVGFQTGSKLISTVSQRSDRVELSVAKRVVAGGQGVGSVENFKLIEQLADKLGAAVGASRAAVEAGYATNDLQVGQTGKIIAPDLYIAVGISGAVQHIAGIKDAKTIVAINQDADAPIFLTADYGVVGDLNELIPQLINALNND